MVTTKKIWFIRALISLLSGLISFACYASLSKIEHIHVEENLTQKAEDFAMLIETAVKDDFQILYNLNSFYKAEKNNVSAEKFSIFSHAMVSNQKALQAIHWAPFVANDQIDEFLTKAKKIYPDYTLKTATKENSLVEKSQDGHHFPILFTEPFEVNKILRGFDPYSTSNRQKTIKKAIQERRISLTEPINLLQNVNIQGVIAIYPFYYQHKLQGLHIAVLNIKEIVYQALKPLGTIEDYVVITDKTDTNNEVEIYNNQRTINEHFKEFKHTIHLPDRNWEISIKSNPHNKNGHENYARMSFAITFLLFIAITAGGFSFLSKTLEKQKCRELKVALEDTEKKVNKISNIKNNLIKAMSFKIRSNVGHIFNISEILKSTKHSKEQDQYFDSIYDICLYISSIMDDIGDLLKVESGALTLHENIFDLHKIIKDTCISYAHQSNKKELDLNFKIDEKTPQYIIVDGYRIKQIINNLIDHILEEIDNGNILINVAAVDQNNETTEISINISTTGWALTEQKIDHLNQILRQNDSDNFFNNDHISINLKLAAQLIHLLEGYAKVVQEKKDTIEIGINLLVKNAHPPKIAEDIINQINNIREHEKPLKILLVEDNQVNQKIAVDHLKSLNIQNIDTAHNGLEAIHKSKQEKYDIIFMDCDLPNMNGYQATQSIRLREADSKYRTPIIAITAHSKAYNREECLKAGMDDYISKPYTLEKFVEKINKWINPL